MTVAFGNSLRKWCTKQFPATIAFASVFYGGYGWDDVLHKCQKMAGKGCPWLLLCCLHLLLNLLSFGSHNWDSSSISGFLSTIQNENRKKQGPGVIIKYCCSMGIWWMIIVSTFLRLHQRILNSSINSFLTDSKSKCLYLVYNKQEKFRDWSSLPLNYKGM